MDTVDCYFDYISPYAYLTWTQLRKASPTSNFQLRARPVLFAGLLNAHGQKGPAEIPAKRRYVFSDIRRSARALGVPIHAPFSHPFNPLGALRLTLAAPAGEIRCRVVDRLFDATWNLGRDVASPHVLGSIARACDIDTSEISSSAIKDRLRTETALAIEAGVFGVPTMVIGGQLYWGLDSLSHLVVYLRDGDPLAGDDEEPWLAVRPSAVRSTG